MQKTSTLRILALCLAAVAAGPGVAQPVTRLSEPAAVPLDFLRWIDEQTPWLLDILADMGLDAQVRIEGVAAVTSDIVALRALNRIRMFTFLAAKGLRPPVFDLPLDDGSRCVTPYPQGVVPGISAEDFRKESFNTAGGDAELLAACKVDDAGEYARLDRTAFRDAYFDASGVLKSEFRELNLEPDFLAAAIDKGFFLSIEDYSGLVRVDEQ